MERETVAVAGMSCDSCERTVENALQNVEGVNRVQADHEGETVEVVVDESVVDEDVRAAIERAGFDVVA